MCLSGIIALMSSGEACSEETKEQRATTASGGGVTHNVEIPYMLLAAALLIFLMGFAAGWMAKPSARAVVRDQGIQAAVPEENVKGGKGMDKGVRRRNTQLGCGPVFTTMTGQCFHKSRECYGRRNAHQITELRMCKICVTGYIAERC